MKILAITPKLPYPWTDGGRICMYQSAHALASLGHDLHVVAIEHEAKDAGRLKEFCHVHLMHDRTLPRAAGALATLLIARPYTQWKKDLRAVYRYLDRLQLAERFDVVYADQAHVACYGSYMKQRYRLPYLLRSHNIEHEVYRRYSGTIRNRLLRAYIDLQYTRWRRYEIMQFRLADACAAITRRDMDFIKGVAPDLPVATIPAAVDLNMFPFVPIAAREKQSLILLGNMNWGPNRDAAIWFTNTILPLIVAEEPEVTCHVVGEGPPLRLFPVSPNLRIEGRLDTIRPLYDRVAIGVIPLRVGGGMRVKMVEMMSSGIPIVSTGIGAEGNDATPGMHYLRADDPPSFASAVVSLLRDPIERERQSLSARTFVAEHFDVRDVGRKFEDLLDVAIKTSTKG